jgi:dTMP kinase
MGKLLVIEGLDGSGKATQAQRLADTLAARGRKVRRVSFPDYKSHSSALARMYLSGDFGQDPQAVNAYAASSFYAVDRYASYKIHWGGFYNEGGLILADRYATSNAIHQCVKLPQAEWPAFVDWLQEYEYRRLEIPAPDLVLCLDVEPEVSQRLLAQRYGEEEKRDIHERDIAYLLRCRKAAHWCAGHLGWRMVVCSVNGAMREREEITRELLSIISSEAL